jgi:translation initiation factor 5B
VYVHHKEVKAALGVKITAPDLEKAIAGSRLLVVGPDDDEDDLRDEIMSDLTSLLNCIDKSGRGVCVQASTLGSLEALLDFLKSSNIPVSGINIGPVHKKDIMRSATMLEKAKELACILCFDVPVDKDAERMAEEMGIRLFKGTIFLYTVYMSIHCHVSGHYIPSFRRIYGLQRGNCGGKTEGCRTFGYLAVQVKDHCCLL